VPRDHAPACTVSARARELTGSLHVELPTVPGALNASRAGDTLVVEAPTPARWAYVALVTETGRLAARALPLTGAGGHRAVHELVEHERRARYAVVSSEPDFRSPALVGWPLDAVADGPPARTFDVRDVKLLDGLPGALQREANRRRGALRVSARGIGAVGLVALLLLWRAFARDAPGERGAPRLPVSTRWLYVGIALAAIGFAGYAVAVWLRVR
jgi:hypothetical protein